MIERILSILFPPRLPGKVRDWQYRSGTEIKEQGWAGNVREHYRDGIQRHFAEEKLVRWHLHPQTRQYITQLHNAEKSIRETEKELALQGYVNTIHDCWEKMG